MAGKGVPGFALIAAGIGGVIAYSGIKGIGVSAAARALLTGQNPSGVTPIHTVDTLAWTDAATSDPAFASSSGIVTTALKYVGVMYNFGKANPTTGWDCSGFCNWVCGHDLGMTLPGGVKGFNGSWHGPPAAMWYTSTMLVTVPRAQIEPGDFCVWMTHMGIAVDAQHMVNAYETGKPTSVTGIDSMAPPGQLLKVRRFR